MFRLLCGQKGFHNPPCSKAVLHGCDPLSSEAEKEERQMGNLWRERKFTQRHRVNFCGTIFV